MENIERKRDANIDLLRIIAIIMVITVHGLGYSGLTKASSDIELYNKLLARFLDSFVLCANVIFILISGYYLIDKKMNIKRILCLWGRTILYSIMYFIIFTILGGNPPIYESFFPILSGQYWFISCYIVLYLISPIINIAFNKLTQSQIKYLLIVLLILIGIVQIIFDPAEILSGNLFGMILIYLIGGYIKRYKITEGNKLVIKSILIAIIFSIIYIILQIWIILNPSKNELYIFIAKIFAKFRNFNNILIIFIGICIFMKFKKTSIKSTKISKLLAFITPSVFSIYILHENINLRSNFWPQLGILNYSNSWLLIPYALLMVILVFAVCLLIDLLRRGLYFLLKKISFINNFVDKLNNKITLINEKINTYIEGITN